jgi:farnesyl diphosphate synthase
MVQLDVPGWLAQQVQRVEGALNAWLPAADAEPAGLHQAMRYAVLGGGKRVRAALVYAAGEVCVAAGAALSPAQRAALDRAAAAGELIHA